MLSKERNEAILTILRKKKMVTTKLLIERLYCSAATLRRSLIELERAGLIKRFHGGVTLIPDTNTEYPHLFREVENQQEKIYICNLAIDYISNGYAIFLDSSSTVCNICPLLSQFKDIKVVTNGVKTALSLFNIETITTYISGGLLKEGSTSVIGELTGNFISNFKANLAIISCRGLDSNGIYEADHMQALVKQHMILNAERTILLCDSSKFNHSHFYKLTTFKNIEAIITNKKPPKELYNAIQSAGCDIIY